MEMARNAPLILLNLENFNFLFIQFKTNHQLTTTLRTAGIYKMFPVQNALFIV